MTERQGTSPWVWIGCGCGIALLLLVAVLAGLGFFAVRMGKEMEAMMADPASRDEQALEILGAEDLPEGYDTMVAMKLPFVMEMAILSDRAPDAEGEIDGFDERGFFYFDFLRLGNEQELRDFFEGRIDNPDVLRENNINFDLDERVAEGELEQDGARILWVAHRGSVSFSDHSGGRGLTTVMLVDCSDDRRRRMAAWFGSDPSPDADPGQLDLVGTVADAAAITDFMGHFHPCR